MHVDEGASSQMFFYPASLDWDDITELFDVEPAEEFDPKYMKALFDFGYQRTMKSETWQEFSKLVETD